MSLLPRTLFGRSLLLIGALVTVAQLGLAIFYLTAVQRPRIERYLDSIHDEARAVGLALSHMTPELRATYLAEMSTSRRFVSVAPTPDPFTDPLVGMLVRRFSARLGHDSGLIWQRRPDRMLWLRLPASDTPMWMGVAVDGVLTDVSTFVLGSSLIGVLLALVGAFLIQRRMNRPLVLLAEAAAEVAAGRPAPLLPRDGTTEIALVATSFNRMAAALERNDRERALMLAGVSHDLRTPLTKLWLGIEMLGVGQDPELVGGMTRSIESANAIIDQFIDYARLGCDEEATRGDVAAVAAEAARAALPIDRRVELMIDAPPFAPLAFRPVAIRRAVANLVVNACRHGRPPLLLRLRDLGDEVEIAVIDHGPGIPPEAIARVMRPFARLDVARGAGGGAGLGLAIVERIAQLHGGELRLVNRPDGGLEARFTLKRE